MAKSKVGGTRAYIRGRIGSDVYSIGKDGMGKKQQVVRSLAEQVANPQTTAQMRGRMIMSTVMQAVAAMNAIVDHSFDNFAAGQPNISEFIRVNYALIKADVAAHNVSGNIFGINKYQEKGVKLGAYQISNGQAVGIANATIDGEANTLTLAIGGTMTVGELKNALGLTVNDYFTICSIAQEGLFVYRRFHFNTSYTDATVISAENVTDLFTSEGNVAYTPSVSGTNVVLTFNALSDCAGIIVSRLENGKYVHNKVVLAAPTDPQWAAADALPTYPTGSQRFLNGGDSAIYTPNSAEESPVNPEPSVQTPAMSAFTLAGQNALQSMSLTNGQAECAVAGTLANAVSGKSYAIVHKPNTSFTLGANASDGAMAIANNTVSGTVTLTQGVLEYFALTEDGVVIQRLGAIQWPSGNEGGDGGEGLDKD